MGPSYETHPVPQNVTSFEFHLVGDMTLKQFVYLATGFAVAYLSYIFLSQSLPFFAWPVIVISLILGVAFAFLPIQERPLDHWMAAFIKAIFKPTQRSYQSKVLPQDNPNFNTRLNIYLNKIAASKPKEGQIAPIFGNKNNTQVQPTQAIPVQAAPRFNPVQAAAAQQAAQRLAQPAIPTSEDLTKTIEYAKEAQKIQTEILETEQKINQIKVSASTPGVNPQQFTGQFQKLLDELQSLNQKSSAISGQLQSLPSTTHTTPAQAVTQKTVTPAKIIPTMTLTTFPNIINGIITDPQGNYLEGAIVVAHDKQGIPVRALKSNKLGQFIAATPLPKGDYNITVEKDGFTFGPVGLELNDEILKPIVVSAKG